MGKPARMTVTDNGRILLIEGAMASGTWQAFRTLLDKSNKVEVVHLDSIGGRIFDADKIAGLVRSKGLDTQVVQECASACTIILLAGRNRMAGRLARIGFHQPDFPGMDAAMRAAMIADNSRIYREAGIAQPFIDRVMATAPANMWFPDYEELMRSGVLTSDEEIIVGRKASVDQVAVAVAREAVATRAQLPMRIDDLTELVEIDAKGRLLTLGYRVAKPIAINQAVKSAMTKAVTAEACASPVMRRYVDAGATIRMAYQDRNQKPIMSIDVATCG